MVGTLEADLTQSQMVISSGFQQLKKQLQQDNDLKLLSLVSM